MPYKKIFVEWLDGELRKRNWTDYELAKRAGISHSVLSRARQGTLPKWAACAAIAQALNLPYEIVFRHAGLVSSSPASDERAEEFIHLFNQLAPRYQEIVVDFIRNQIEEQGRLKATIEELQAATNSGDIKKISDIFLGYIAGDDSDIER